MYTKDYVKIFPEIIAKKPEYVGKIRKHKRKGEGYKRINNYHRYLVSKIAKNDFTKEKLQFFARLGIDEINREYLDYCFVEECYKNHLAEMVPMVVDNNCVTRDLLTKSRKFMKDYEELVNYIKIFERSK